MTLLAINSIWYIIPNSLAVENSICYFLLFLLTRSSKTTVKFAKGNPIFIFFEWTQWVGKNLHRKKKLKQFFSCTFFVCKLFVLFRLFMNKAFGWNFSNCLASLAPKPVTSTGLSVIISHLRKPQARPP